MDFTEIQSDIRTGLALVCDERDPPRYYLQERRRRDLLAIGDKALALKRFAVRIGRQTASTMLAAVKRAPPKEPHSGEAQSGVRAAV